jgi:hypothetical protein
MERVLNLGLMRHPGNWVIVFLMATSAALAVKALYPETPPAA